jgi:hypothetical protein
VIVIVIVIVICHLLALAQPRPRSDSANPDSCRSFIRASCIQHPHSLLSISKIDLPRDASVCAINA